MLNSPLMAKAGRLSLLCALAASIVLVGGLAPSADPALAASHRDRADPTCRGLTELTACELERMYASAEVGNFPTGFLRGRLLVMTDYPFPRATVTVSQWGWKGKHIGCDGTFINQFT